MAWGFPDRTLFKSCILPVYVPPGTAEAVVADLKELGSIEVIGRKHDQKKTGWRRLFRG